MCGPRNMPGRCRCKPCGCPICVARTKHAKRSRTVARTGGKNAGKAPLSGGQNGGHSGGPEPATLFDMEPAPPPEADAGPLKFRTGE
jgi:hypothetical protein